MKRIDLYFLLLAAVMLTAGVVLGLVMGARHDFTLSPIHAHVNLIGWASLALFGLVYRAYPELAARKLAAAHFFISSTSAILFPVGLLLAVFQDAPLLAILAGVLWLLGCIIFLLQLISLFGSREANNEASVVAAE